MLNVGLIGLGPHWEQCYRPALEKLAQRICVRAVYAPVASLAEQVAGELECHATHGMLALMERADVRAVLVLDEAWFPGVPAELACRAGKPAFLTGPSRGEPGAATRLGHLAVETGVTLTPEFAHRYTPATSRLRELIASRLGRPIEILVEHGPGAGRASGTRLPGVIGDALACALDWCCYLVGTAPAQVGIAECAGTGHPVVREIVVEFRRPAGGGDAAFARIRLPAGISATTSTVDGGCEFRATVRCARGHAVLEGAHQVNWQNAAENAAESLAAERSEIEVMLDHFSRRVVGGLVPVPTLEDVRRAQFMAERARQCLATGGHVALDERQ